MKRFVLLAVLLLLTVLGIYALLQLGTRSGVTREQVTETLPGDSIIPNAWIAIDRAATLPASASTSWPWVEQLGKDRAGWYAPRWLENTIHEYAASSTEPKYQNLKVGDVIPDWGGGSLKVLAIEQDQYIVYGSIHDAATSSAAITDTNYSFTWTLILENDTATSSSFHLRLRLTPPTHGIGKYIPPAIPGFIDYLTDIVMFAGLQERLR